MLWNVSMKIRSYKNGYVWHDASDDDVIQPTNNHDYVIKGTELLQAHLSLNQLETCHTNDACSSKTTAPADSIVVRRNQSWSSFDNPQVVMDLGNKNRLVQKYQ